MIRFFYGMSGALKGTTITAIKKASDIEICSMIKPWKDFRMRIFKDTKPEDHRDYTLLHLVCLKNGMIGGGGKDIIVERGVTDSLYYWSRGFSPGREIEDIISRAVKEELEIVENNEIQKILLVNKDTDFIRDVVLREPHRSQVFPGGVSEYLEEQEKYASFTSRWNKINEIREITNARDYVEGLGLEYY